MGRNSSEYTQQYNQTHYDNVYFRIPKGAKIDLQQLAEDRGQSLSTLIIETLEDALNVDLHTKRK